MKYLYRLLIVLASASFFYASAQAQNSGSVPNHAVPIGKGPGVTGFSSVLGVSGQALFGVTGADPAFRSPSFTDLVGNISVSQMNSGTNASASTMWRGDGTWAAPETMPFTAANGSPAAQSLQLALRTKVGVTCEDFSAFCGSADDTTAVQAAVNYAASTGRCFYFNRTFIVTTIVVANAAHLCMTGKGGLIGKTGTTASAVLEIKNTIGTTIDGNITLNCNSQSGYTAGLKVWSDGLSTGQFNPRISLAAIANCKLAAQYGDTIQPDNTFSENFLTIGYTYNCAQGVKVIGIQAVLSIVNSIIVIDPSNWPGVTNYGLISVGSAIQMIGGEIVNPSVSTGAAVRMEALTSLAYTNSYGNVHISGTLIETYTGASIANPSGVTSPQGGGFYCVNCYGAVLNDVGPYISAADDFIGKISVTSSRFFGTLSRSNPNISSNSSSIYFDLESFGTNMLQGYAGISGTGVHRMVSKDVALGVVVTGTSATQGKGDSIVTFNGSGTYTYTLLAPTVYPGRVLYLNNVTANAVNSASSNILVPGGTTTASLLPAVVGSWVILISDTSQGNFWRLVASGGPTGLTTTYGLSIAGSPVTGGGNVAANVSLSSVTNSMGADVLLNNTASYFIGPSVAQGSTGTWFVSGTVTLVAGSADQFNCRLTDGTTILASGNGATPAATPVRTTISLSSVAVSPAGNLRIECQDISTTSGAIKFNASGNSKDSTITAIRLQ